MPIATVSSKGQITLPASVRKRLGIKPSERLNVQIDGKSITLTPVIDFMSLKGSFKTGRKIGWRQAREEMMDAAAADGMRGVRRRSS